MKKKLNLIFIIIILFTIGKSEVYAEELTCIYKGGMNQASVMLVQDANNNKSVYLLNEKEADIDNAGWWEVSKEEKYAIKYEFNDAENTDYLTACPKYNNYDFHSLKSTYTFKFYDKKGLFTLDYELYKTYNYAYESKIIDDNSSQEWLMTCYYEPVNIYYNDEGMNLTGNDDIIINNAIGFTYEELKKYYETYKTCPSIYQETNSYLYATYYLTSGKNRIKFYPETNSVVKNNKTNTDTDTKEGCELLGETTLEYITEINSIIRIVVPILLIVLIIIDLVKAVFSGSSEEVNKIKKKIIKRIIIAIIIFLVPTLINVLLKLVNEIWPEINPDICGLE